VAKKWRVRKFAHTNPAVVVLIAKSFTTKGTKDHEGFWLQIFPSCTLVPLVVQDFIGAIVKLHHYHPGQGQDFDASRVIT
jgi:hypothetical protein